MKLARRGRRDRRDNAEQVVVPSRDAGYPILLLVDSVTIGVIDSRGENALYNALRAASRLASNRFVRFSKPDGETARRLAMAYEADDAG